MNNPHIQWFRHASPYINAYRHKTFVVNLPGDALLHDNLTSVAHDLLLLHSLGVRLVLVHGCRPQINARFAEAGRECQFEQGQRITPPQDLPLVLQAIGATRLELDALLSAKVATSWGTALDAQGSAPRVINGNFLKAMPLGVLDGVDFQLTGKIRKVDTKSIHRCLENNALVLISPIGYSATGETFNLCSHSLAADIALALRADKLIQFMADDGIYDDNSQLIRHLSLNTGQQLLDRMQQSEGNPQRQYPLSSADWEPIQALRNGIRVCRGGVPRTQIISFRQDGALLQELFTRDGKGTLIHGDRYDSLRTATIADVGGILALIEPLEQQGVLVRRSRERLENEISQFMVMERDGAIIACAALYPFANYPPSTVVAPSTQGDTASENDSKGHSHSDDHWGELACLATHPDYRNGGRARQLLDHIESYAQHIGLTRIFVLTTQTAHWFVEQGFDEVDLSQLPPQRQSLYNLQRRSKVLMKSL